MAQPGKEPKIIHRKPTRKAGSSSGPRRMDNTRKPSLLRFTLIFIYKNLYVLGITLLRRRLRMRRRIRKFFLRLRGSSLRWWEKSKEAFSRFRRRLIQRIAAPFVRLGTVRSQMRPIIERSKQDGKIPIQAYFNITLTFFRLLFTILRTLFNYAVPIVAAVLLIHMIDGRMNQPFGLMCITRCPHRLIETESDFEAARELRGYIARTPAPYCNALFCSAGGQTGRNLYLPKELANRILAPLGYNRQCLWILCG